MIDFFIKEPNIYFIGSSLSLIAFIIFFLKMKRIMIYISGVTTAMLMISGTISVVIISKTEASIVQYEKVAGWAKNRIYKNFIIQKLKGKEFMTKKDYEEIDNTIELFIEENQ